MVEKDTLRQIVTQQKSSLSLAEKTVARELLDEILPWLKDNRVIILTGIRRSGKSTLLRQMMERETGYAYVNFEDERFIGFKAEDFEMLNEVLTESYDKIRTYFFDEIQNIEKFEAFVRRLQDQGKKIIITGSNASLLSKELGTKLTGRYKAFEVYPFSFREYLIFKNINPSKEWFYLTEKKVELIRLFNDYREKGGFPEYLKNNDQEYLKTIYDNILYRDIIARYAIKKQKILKELVGVLAASVSSPFTYNALKKSLGLANSITVKEYISYLNNAYLFFELQKFDYSLRKQLDAPKKIYFIDSAFSQVVGMNFSMNQGKVLENIVFIELKRKKSETYYYSGSNECDFVIKKGARIIRAIQACQSLSNENREREVKGLLEAMSKFKLKEGLILTQEQEEEIKVKGRKIKVMPVWKWLLE
ncbi:MAG TPA: ATP-binding protein [Candidatus Nanoarchaeia archaeon]|nr:ATP-binding protein [Candidatus Nanoarchaeia archaeon]